MVRCSYALLTFQGEGKVHMKTKHGGNHRTLGAHVPESLWQSLHFLAEKDETSCSVLVRCAVEQYLARRKIAVVTYEQLVGENEMDWRGGDNARDNA